MASDRHQFRHATQNWEQLHEEDAYSVPCEFGTVAVICSDYADVYDDEVADDRLTNREVRNFRREASCIANELSLQGITTELALGATAVDFLQALRDPSISTIFTIGHGSLSLLYLPSPETENEMDWLDVASTVDHLKTGEFIQRHCGHLTRDLPVPLGLFAMTDHFNVVAPVGRYFHPRGLQHPHNQFMRPVTTKKSMSYRDIKNEFRGEAVED